MHRTHDDIIENNTVTDITNSSNGQCIDADGFGTVEWKHTIRGNKLTRCGLVGIQLENVFSGVVENNIINNPGSIGIAIISYGPTIPSPGTSKCQADPTNTYGDTNGDNNCEGDLTNNIVRQNLIYNTAIESGFVSYHAGGIKLLGNTIIGNSSSKWGVRLDNSLYFPQIEMQSNIIANHSESEILAGDYASFTTDTNNLFYNSNPSHVYQRSDGKTYWELSTLAQYQSATGKGQHSIFADPQLVYITGTNFHLNPVSPAINQGMNIGLPTDLDGVIRLPGYDIGAYEFVSTPAPTVTPTVQPSLAPTPSMKPGDANRDNKVNGTDYVTWLGHFGQTATPNNASVGNFNTDTKVDGLDYVVWLNNFGK
jgi:hypothetical protein